jgi:citrate lyase beta subunit
MSVLLGFMTSLTTINVRHYKRCVSIDLSQSFLFVPADRRDRALKAGSTGADAVILDLEDGVVPERKVEARSVAEELLRSRPGASAWLVRINGAGSPFFADDLELVAGSRPDAFVLPKADPAALDRVESGLPPVVALIETAAGLAGAATIAADPRVARLQLGGVDLSLELRLRPRPDGLELLHPRATLVLASALERLPAPIDSVFVEIDDLAGLERDARLGRDLGFSGKACIHPTQVDVVNRVLRPTADEVAAAQAVLDVHERAAAEGVGVIRHEGAMVDRPLVEQARRVLEQAARRG